MFVKNPEAIECKLFLATDRQHLVLQKKGYSPLAYKNGRWYYRHTDELTKLIEGGELS